MPGSLTGQTQPWFTVNPSATVTMVADTYIEIGKLKAVSFDDAVTLTFKDGLDNEDSVSIDAFPVSIGIDSSITHIKTDIDTTLHGMFG